MLVLLKDGTIHIKSSPVIIEMLDEDFDLDASYFPTTYFECVISSNELEENPVQDMVVTINSFANDAFSPPYLINSDMGYYLDKYVSLAKNTSIESLTIHEFLEWLLQISVKEKAKITVAPYDEENKYSYANIYTNDNDTIFYVENVYDAVTEQNRLSYAKKLEEQELQKQKEEPNWEFLFKDENGVVEISANSFFNAIW